MKICEYFDEQLKKRFQSIIKIEENVEGCDSFWKKVYEINGLTVFISAEYAGLSFYVYKKMDDENKFICTDIDLFADSVKAEKSNIDKMLNYLEIILNP